MAEETIRAYFETRLALLEPVFPLACHRLCEGPDFSLEFSYKPPQHTPGEGKTPKSKEWQYHKRYSVPAGFFANAEMNQANAAISSGACDLGRDTSCDVIATHVQTKLSSVHTHRARVPLKGLIHQQNITAKNSTKKLRTSQILKIKIELQQSQSTSGNPVQTVY